MKRETLERLLADRRAQQPVVLVTELASGEQRLMRPGADDMDAGLRAAAEAALRRDEAQRFESEAGAFFLQPFAPPSRLIIVGAVHIAQPLAAMAALAGYAVVIVDPRQAFASEARFPGVALSSEWPDAAVAKLAPDSRTAVVTLTHDPKLDDPALAAALRSPAFYVGALGSKKTPRGPTRAPARARHRRGRARAHPRPGRSRPRGALARRDRGLDPGRAHAALARREAVRLGHAAGEPPRVGAVFLAAGLSRRMGAANKLLAEFEGAPMVVRSVDAVLASRARPVVVVTGHEAGRLRQVLAGRELSFVHNPDYAVGLSTSLRAGIAAFGDEVDGAVICLADMPWVRAEHIDALLDAFSASGANAICVPTWERKRGNPVLWPARCFVEIAALTGDAGARALLERHADSVCHVPVADPGVTRDVDMPGALSPR